MKPKSVWEKLFGLNDSEARSLPEGTALHKCLKFSVMGVVLGLGAADLEEKARSRLSPAVQEELEICSHVYMPALALTGPFCITQIMEGSKQDITYVSYALAVSANVDMLSCRFFGMSLCFSGVQAFWHLKTKRFKVASAFAAVAGLILYFIPNILGRNKFLDAPRVCNAGADFERLASSERMIYQYFLHAYWNSPAPVKDAAERLLGFAYSHVTNIDVDLFSSRYTEPFVQFVEQERKHHQKAKKAGINFTTLLAKESIPARIVLARYTQDLTNVGGEILAWHEFLHSNASADVRKALGFFQDDLARVQSSSHWFGSLSWMQNASLLIGVSGLSYMVAKANKPPVNGQLPYTRMIYVALSLAFGVGLSFGLFHFKISV